MRDLKIDLNGESYKVKAQKINGKLWLHLNGQTIVFEPESKRRGHTATEEIDSGTILAPMPGKILKVNFKEGDTVNPGEVIVSMEAMKMEYSLSVDVTGTIKTINCAEGDQVSLEQLLVEVEEN